MRYQQSTCYQQWILTCKDAGLRLVQIIHRTHPVQVAFWLMSSDDMQLRLYIGGDWVEFPHSKEAYKVVFQAIDELNDPDLDLSPAVIPMSHNLAKAALEFWQKYPNVLPSWSKDGKFGEIDVECVYLYPINDEWNQKNEDFHSKISKAVEKMKNRPVSQKIKTLVEIGSITQEQADLILEKIPNPELPLDLIEKSEADLKSAKIKYSTDDYSVEDLIEELLIWLGTFRDAPDNFDAKLLKKAASVLQEQWDRIGELEDILDLKNT